MARHTEGWLKLHRRITTSAIGRDANTLAIWTTIMCWANWTESTVIRRGELLQVRRGTLLTSSQELATQLGIERKTVERRLDMLASLGSIEMQVSNRGRMITLINYEEYQGSDTDAVQQSGAQNGVQNGAQNGDVGKKRSKQASKNKPPLNPPGGGKYASAAAALVEKVIGAANRKLDEQGARDFVGAADFDLVMTRHNDSWQRFLEWVFDRTKKRELRTVERDLRRTYAGLLSDRARKASDGDDEPPHPALA